MVHCCVIGCKSRSERKLENITFHSFPVDLGLRNAWISVCGRQDWYPTKHTRVCSSHFEERCFRKTAKMVLLRDGSMPKLFVHGVPQLKVLHPKRGVVNQRGEINATMKTVNLDKITEGKAEIDDLSDHNYCIYDDTPRATKLKQDIWLLRKKAREDGIKIKCLQNKIRRILRKQGKTKNTDKAAPSKKRGLKRRRITPAISPSATDTAESTESEESTPSSPASSVNRIACNEETDKVYKTEPLDDEGVDDGLSADKKEYTGLEVDEFEDVKIEIDDDPLMIFGESNG